MSTTNAQKNATKKAMPRKKVAKASGGEETTKRKRGRPSRYTVELADEIISRIAQGETLRAICRDEHMPGWVTVYSWRETVPGFAERLARARDDGEEAIAQECMEIADSAKNDWMETHGQDDVGYKLNGEHVQRSKLRIETRLKLLAIWNPKKWGAKVDLNHGVQPENPLAKLLEQVQGTPMRPAGGDDK